MKLVSLNTWSGIAFDPLMDFVSEQGRDTDVFCFQEVFDTPTDRKTDGKYRVNLLSELRDRLSGHSVHFSPSDKGHLPNGTPVDYDLFWGLAMFLRMGLDHGEVHESYIYECSDNVEIFGKRNLQHTTIPRNGVDYTVAHFHGLWNGQGKTDTPDRIEQSIKARALLDGLNGKKVLCGDFNLLPDTESLAILKEGLVDLIETHEITTTRSSFYERPERFADYTLVSPEVNVRRFEVPQIEVSDHLPMILEYS